MTTSSVRKVKKAQAVDAIAADTIHRGLEYLQSIQETDGAWKGDYGGPLFLLPGYVFTCYATKTPIDAKTTEKLVAYIESVQAKDGGFGLHVEGKSYLFTTVLNYVALRLLGRPADDPRAARARAWILNHGGALWISSWGKFWLALMRLYEYEGMNPVPPELWLLPESFALHPSKLWCHCRVVYLPMSYLYGRKWQVEDAAILREIRGEIYDRPYAEVDFANGRNRVAPTDLYTPHTKTLDALNAVLTRLERRVPRSWRKKALALTLDHIKHEQLTTTFIDIGPVNKALDTIACYAAEGLSAHTQKCIAALPQYLFDGEDGLKMQGYNSSELWDTAFAAQAIAETGRGETFRPMLEKAFGYIERNQVLEDVPEREKYFRDPSQGGWPFSNRAHGWPIVDCTAEGLKASLLLGGSAAGPRFGAPLATPRLIDAVDLLLFWQNDDGGWATYEKRRGGAWLELVNPSEVFGKIMTDYSYVELSSAAMQGLAAAEAALGCDLVGGERLARMHAARARGAEFIRGIQRADGSWEGSWGVCFTYGTWFGVWGLLAGGASPDDPALVRARDFLLSKQLPGGGWGESYLSCETGRYTHHPDGAQVVMTAWALMALLKLDHAEAREAIARGVDYLVRAQLVNGDWPKQGIAGVFNKSCMIHYRFYRNYFPIWALALAEKQGFAIGAGRSPS